MDYEKKHKEALERAKESMKDGGISSNTITYIESIFPELKESEDERIRKAVIGALKDSDIAGYGNYNIEDLIAWLEKQGEQNYKIIKGKNYFCVKTHNYAGIEWIKGTKYYASDNYTLVNQGCECYCPEYSKEEHNNLFEEVKYDGCVEKQGEQKHTAEEVLIKSGLKPYKDGDQWCVLLGNNIQEGICGFGKTIEDALYAFLKDLIASQGEQKQVEVKPFNKVFSQEQIDEIDKRIETEIRLYNAKLMDAQMRAKDFPMTD